MRLAFREIQLRCGGIERIEFTCKCCHAGQGYFRKSRKWRPDARPRAEGHILAAENRVRVNAQPFGGPDHINDLTPLLERTGGFHFDSERSRAEQDFRILRLRRLTP